MLYLGEEKVEAGLDIGDHGGVVLGLPVHIRDPLLGHGLYDLAEDGPVAYLRLQVLDASPSLCLLYNQRGSNRRHA